MGELDNTIFVFTSDNGASREGEVEGTTGYYVHLLRRDRPRRRPGPHRRDRRADHHRRTTRGAGPWRATRRSGSTRSTPTPAATRCRSSLSWPAGFAGGGELAARQYTHVTDVLPDAARAVPASTTPTERDGRRAAAARRHQLRRRCSTTPTRRRTHTEQYYEMLGHRGFYRDGWEVVTLHRPLTEFGDHEWELYDLAADPTETTRPGRRAPRAGGRAGRGVGAGGLGQPGVPARRGQRSST